jgi:hypothetical protein
MVIRIDFEANVISISLYAYLYLYFKIWFASFSPSLSSTVDDDVMMIMMIR